MTSTGTHITTDLILDKTRSVFLRKAEFHVAGTAHTNADAVKTGGAPGADLGQGRHTGRHRRVSRPGLRFDAPYQSEPIREALVVASQIQDLCAGTE